MLARFECKREAKDTLKQRLKRFDDVFQFINYVKFSQSKYKTIGIDSK